MREYVEPVDVRQGRVGSVDGPTQFLWRHRLYLVRDVLGSWVESTSWWRAGGAGFAERQVWRVEASRGRHHACVIADLALNPVDGQWVLVRTYD